MNQPAFILEFSRNEVPAITAARSLADDLAANVPITRKHLSETFRCRRAIEIGRHPDRP